MVDLRTHHLQKCEVAHCNIIKVDLHIDPKEASSVVLTFTVRHVIHSSPRHKKKAFTGLVDAFLKLPCKEVHTHDAEDEPEDEADEEDVHDGGDGTHQGIYHHLGGKAERPGTPPMPHTSCPIPVLSTLTRAAS